MARLADVPDPRDLGHYARELAHIADGLAADLGEARAGYQALKAATWNTPGQPPEPDAWAGMTAEDTLRQARDQSLAFDREGRHREDAFRLRRALKGILAACGQADDGTLVRRLAEEALAVPEPA
jgi:hypothetical protein